MNNNNKSSIEWFAERIQSDKIFSFEKVLEQAKAMHKAEIEKALIIGATSVLAPGFISFEKYYDENFNQ